MRGLKSPQHAASLGYFHANSGYFHAHFGYFHLPSLLQSQLPIEISLAADDHSLYQPTRMLARLSTKQLCSLNWKDLVSVILYSTKITKPLRSLRTSNALEPRSKKAPITIQLVSRTKHTITICSYIYVFTQS